MAVKAIDSSWRRFKKYNDQSARSAIINNYAYLVKITAGRVVTNLPPNLEREDLYTAGSMGLIKAVDQFDPARQVGGVLMSQLSPFGDAGALAMFAALEKLAYS